MGLHVGLGELLSLPRLDYLYGEGLRGIRRLPTFGKVVRRRRSRYAWNWTLNAQPYADEQTVAAHMLLDHLSQNGDSCRRPVSSTHGRAGGSS